MQIHNFYLLLGYFLWLILLLSALLFAFSTKIKRSRRGNKKKQIAAFFQSDKRSKKSLHKMMKYADDVLLFDYMFECFQAYCMHDPYFIHVMKQIYRSQYAKTKPQEYLKVALLNHIKEALF